MQNRLLVDRWRAELCDTAPSVDGGLLQRLRCRTPYKVQLGCVDCVRFLRFRTATHPSLCAHTTCPRDTNAKNARELVRRNARTTQYYLLAQLLPALPFR